MNPLQKGVAVFVIFIMSITLLQTPINTYSDTISPRETTLDLSAVQSDLSDIHSDLSDIQDKIKKIDPDTPSVPSTVPTKESNLAAKKLKGASRAEFIRAIGPIAQKDYQKNGVLASVTIAQAILESGGGQSSLAQNANNLFGMKKNLSGNSWSDSTWTGSVYKKRTAEYTKKGKKYYITASFRKYKGISQSIGDHSAYLIGAKNGKKKRYAGLTKTKSYAKQIDIIQKGGYATSSSYGNSLKNMIKKYDLTKYDVK